MAANIFTTSTLIEHSLDSSQSSKSVASKTGKREIFTDIYLKLARFVA